MKNSFSIKLFPKDFTILGLSYEEGLATNTETEESFPLHRFSLGFILMVFEFILVEKGGK
jgi:hypothetical protein